MKAYPIIAMAIALCTSVAFAHGGRTNSDGCHTNRKTGDYHCHGGASVAPPSNTQKEKAVDNESATGSGYTCGSKTKCAQMESCEEAMFYLNTCGLSRLDRDKDGVPCESICK